jgi:hypothetical protein
LSQEPLGTLLVERGLITKEQLEAALAGQHATGEQLGQIDVSRGNTTPAMVAQALATQHGGLLKTEYGFATGFQSGESSASFTEPPVTAPAASSRRRGVRHAAAARSTEVMEPQQIVDPRADQEAVREELSMAAAETERLRDDNARLAELRSTLEQRLATESHRAASLERDLAAAQEQHRPENELEGRLADETRRVADLEAQLAARDATIDAFEAVADSWRTGFAERDAAIASFKAVTDSWQTALAERDAAITGLRAARDAALETLGARESEVAELAAARDEALARVEGKDAEIARLAVARDEALARRNAVEGLTARVSELVNERDAALAKLHASEAELASLVAAREEETVRASTAGADPWAAADRHLLFFQGPEGYELVERDGPPPASGTHVQLESGTQVVARIAASPAPGPRVPCAYLIAG